MVKIFRHVPDTMMKLETGTAGKRNREFFAMTDPNQFLICEKVLRTLEEDALQTRVESPALSSHMANQQMDDHGNPIDGDHTQDMT
jgi:hypothetical protein